MMKKILILAYIVAVLALSGMVKASTINPKNEAIVQDAKISTTGILELDVVMRDSCQSRPQVKANIDQENKIVSLDVRTQLRSATCLDRISPPKKIFFDLKSLPLRVGSTYEISYQEYSGNRANLNYMAVAGDLNEEDYKLEPKDFKGVLVPMLGTEQNTAGLALRNENNEVVPVKSPDMLPQLSSLVNGEVYLTGYAVSIAALNDGTETPTQSSQSENFAQVIVPVSVSQ